MAIADQQSPAGMRHSFDDLGWPGQKLILVLHVIHRALGAMRVAPLDHRQLSEMSDRQLRLRGLARTDIPPALHQRHFASLGGWLDNID